MEVLVVIPEAVPTPSPVPLVGSMACGASMPCGAGTSYISVRIPAAARPGDGSPEEEVPAAVMERKILTLEKQKTKISLDLSKTLDITEAGGGPPGAEAWGWGCIFLTQDADVMSRV